MSNPGDGPLGGNIPPRKTIGPLAVVVVLAAVAIVISIFQLSHPAPQTATFLIASVAIFLVSAGLLIRAVAKGRNS